MMGEIQKNREKRPLVGRAILKRFAKDRRGSTAVEFTLLAVPFLSVHIRLQPMLSKIWRATCGQGQSRRPLQRRQRSGTISVTGLTFSFLQAARIFTSICRFTRTMALCR
jgi:Flp pilus assembly pilin Flp